MPKVQLGFSYEQVINVPVASFMIADTSILETWEHNAYSLILMFLRVAVF